MLPPVLAFIARRTSLAVALQLLEDFGGLEISVPQRLDADHPVAMSIGLENANVVGELIRGGGIGDGVRRLLVPRGDGLFRARRNAAVRAAVAAGESKVEAARRFGISTRTARRICNDGAE
jgi:hypothetical protein